MKRALNKNCFCSMSFLIYAFTVPSPVDLDHGAYLPLFLLYLSFQIPF